uniref:Uncharacterized protein n=1 Tax=Anopheles albimanus TaxID=7167 RepID=A0A182FYW0_ANOAL
MVGWGLNDDYGVAPNVRQIVFQLRTDAACTATHGSLVASVQCAKYVQGSTFCYDSGSPLVCNGRLYGILSDISQCLKNPASELFARLTAPSIQSFLFGVLRRTNYLTCPCLTCLWQ